MKPQINITAEQVKTLEQAGIIPANTPSAQIAVFAAVCNERGLSAFSKEIYLVGYGGKYSTIVGINGLRKLATDSGQFAGCDDAKYDLDSSGNFKTAADLIAARQMPTTCSVTVYRIVCGIRVPFSHTAVYKEFAGSGKWQTMPFQMIAKVAESFALRKGFSDRMTGLHIEEEADALADTQVVAVAQQSEQNAKVVANVRQLMERVELTDREISAANLILSNPSTQLEKLRAMEKKLWERIQEEKQANDPVKQFKQAMA